MVAGIPLDNLFQILSVRLNAERADGLALTINLNFRDAAPTVLAIENSVLHAFSDRQVADAKATLSINALNFKLLMVGQADAMNLMSEGELEIDGDASVLIQLAGLFDQFERRFPLVTPRPAWGE